MRDIESGIAIGETGRKMMVVVDSKVKEIRASFCSLLLCVSNISVYTLIQKINIVSGVGEENIKKNIKIIK